MNIVTQIKKKEYLLVLLLLVLAAWFRLKDIGTIMVIDEKDWIARGILFGAAVKEMNFAETILAGHPGVPTMWLSSLGALIAHYFSGVPLLKLTDNLEPYLFPGQLLFALVSVLSLPLFYFFLRKIFSVGVAMLALGLMAMDPFLIAHSRIIHVDALLFNFVILALSSFLWFLKEEEKKALLISGVFTGLAILTKSPAIILLPFVGAFFFWLRKKWTDFLSWLIVIGVVMFLIWPAMWVSPGDAIGHVADRTSLAVQQVHGAEEYALNPNYYLGTLIFYLTPLSLPLVAASVGLLAFSLRGLLSYDFKLKRFISENEEVFYAALLLCFAAGYFLLLTIGAKKGHRYFIPTFPIWNVLVAFTTFKLRGLLLKHQQAYFKLFLTSVGGALILQSISLMRLHPYYLAYYNPLLPKPVTAKMGWGEGLERAAEYLNTKPQAGELVVASWYPEVVGAFFKGRVINLKDRKNPEVDYVVVYRGMFGRGAEDPATKVLNEYYPIQKPEITIYINGLEYIWVYSSKKEL